MKLRPPVLFGLLASACSSAAGPNDSGSHVDEGGSNSSDAVAVDAADALSPDASGDTWGSWAQGFFSTYCVECHSASDPTGRDFTMQSIVVANKLAIRCGVCSAQDPTWGCPASPHAQQFPISDATGSNPKPSAAERDRVVAWITAGCP